SEDGEFPAAGRRAELLLYRALRGAQEGRRREIAGRRAAMATVIPARAVAVSRARFRDGVFVGLSIAHAVVLCTVASIPVLAIGMWWSANTIAHNFIHRPFFRTKAANVAYSAFLSLVLGVPQSLWRERHLAHHAGRAYGGRTGLWSADVVAESALVISLWGVLATIAPGFLLTVYAPGYLLGLGLCFLQGHFEHAGGTTSHYSWLYNRLFFNDGYHIEHHRRPGVHWTQLPFESAGARRSSRWPPVLRWLDALTLEFLERIALKSSWIQRYVLRAHERAFRAMLPGLPAVRHVTIVGGGLFPRTALILRKLRPDASLTIIDASGDH